MYRTTRPIADRRRAVILVVVLSLLALFAVVGLSFVLYADATAAAARVARDAEEQARPDIAPELLLSYFLGQLIYDVPDDPSGYYSALRGHSLARNMFGLNPAAPNDVPFNGVGRLHFVGPLGDEYYLPNYTYFQTLSGPLRHPEKLANNQYFGFNAPYTYPDLNCMFLAEVDSNGQVVQPSFDRLKLLRALGQNPTGNRYMDLRPLASDNSGFPNREDGFADVKNWASAPGGNDSIWIDLGFPAMTLPDGRKFKPLFAPLIIDLDNRLNLLAHGNVRGQGGSPVHLSHSGWGPWEVNLEKVFGNSEWVNLFTGTTVPYQEGRYGPDKQPTTNNTAALPGTMPRYFGRVNYDGATTNNMGPFAPPQRMLLPGEVGNTNPPFYPFPHYQPATFGDGDQIERTNHPLLFNPFTPGGDDRLFRLSNMEALLRYGETGSPMLTSEFFRLCPNAFQNGGTRRSVTTRSFDLTRPGVTPWIWPAPGAAYTYKAGDPAPTGQPIPFPALPIAPAGNPPTEFGIDWRAANAALGRLDLNRTLPNYPLPDATGRIPDDDPATPGVQSAAFTAAQAARQRLALDIFRRLVSVTGADPTATPGTDSYNALRWLAQLAVNIVDYIDVDDYITPFGSWNSNREYVFGTELPRVVVNEVYAEYGNDEKDPDLPTNKMATRFKCNVWVELCNLFTDDPIPGWPGGLPWPAERAGRAILEMPETVPGMSKDNYPVYQVIITTKQGLGGANGLLRQPGNTTGDPAFQMGDLYSVVGAWPAPPAPGHFYLPDPLSTSTPPMGVDTRFIEKPNPAKGSGYYTDPLTNSGFYILAPYIDPTAKYEKNPFPRVGTNAYATVERSEMSFVVPAGMQFDPTAPPRPSVLLRRLACPNLPPQLNPNLPLFNPFITVDYVTDVPANYAAEYSDKGQNMPKPKDVTERLAYGRRQPYAADVTQQVAQAPKPLLTDQPQNTFFRHNAIEPAPGPADPAAMGQTLALPFDWLVHLDRQLISPMELLHISGYKPHELTQQFITAQGKFKHYIPWLDQNTRLYRAFEFLATGNRTQALSPVGINIILAGNVAADPVNPQPVTLSEVYGTTPSGTSWRIRPGDVLVVGQDNYFSNPPTLNQEHVIVLSVDAANKQITAIFQKGHSAGTVVRLTTIDHRIPGKININTVRHREILRAVADASTGNAFTEADVDLIFQQLVTLRDGDLANNVPPRPFLGLAAGVTNAGDVQYPQGLGIADTILRPKPGPNGTLFQVTGNSPHPYPQYELLTKIFNHLTTRSNVFAVWITVGFFEVKDDTTRPVRLGAEIGRAEGRHVRHRMFAIVDRSNLIIPVPVTTGTVAAGSPTLIVASLQGMVQPSYPLNSHTWAWSIEPGMWITVGEGATQETRQVAAVDRSTLTVTTTAPFAAAHVGESVYIAGNPGPQPKFDVRQNRAVVPYFSIID